MRCCGQGISCEETPTIIRHTAGEKHLPLLHTLLLFSACLSSAAQESPKVPDPHESDRRAYDEIYSKDAGVFSAAPNSFMVRSISGRKPGRALDVAMGQGRNAL